MKPLLGKILFLPLVAIVSVALFYVVGMIGLEWLVGRSPDPVNVEQGSAYGVTIGASRDQTYGDLLQAFPVRQLIVAGTDIDDAPGQLGIVEDSAYELLMRQDRWLILFTPERPDTLELRFADDALVKITRAWWPGDVP